MRTFLRSIEFRFGYALAWLAGAFMLLSCGSPTDSVQIGFVGPLTGRGADLGVDGRDGALLAVEELAAEGRKVRLLIQDDAGVPQKAAAAVDLLADSGIRTVVGPFTSGVAGAALERATQRGVLLISPTVTADPLFGREDAMALFLSRVATQARTIVDHLNTDTSLPLAILHDQSNEAYAGLMARTVDSLSRLNGLRVVARLTYVSEGRPAFDSLLRIVRVSEAKTLVAVVSGLDLAAILGSPALPDFLEVVASHWSATLDPRLVDPEVLSRAVFAMTPSIAESDPIHRRFAARFRTRFGRDPNHSAYLSWLATQAACLPGIDASDPPAVRARRLPAAISLSSRPEFAAFALDSLGDAVEPKIMLKREAGRWVKVPPR